MKRFLITFLLIFAVISTTAFMLQVELTQETIAAVSFVITILVGFLGPRPVGWMINKLTLTGQWAVLFTYGVALVVATLALLISQQLFQFAFIWENALAIAGLLFGAATYSYHRLKDQERI